MTTEDLDQWINNLQSHNPQRVYYGGNGSPISNPVPEPAPRRYNVHKQGYIMKSGNKYKSSRKVKNSEGTKTDSFYYVGMDEVEEYDNWPVQPEHQRKNSNSNRAQENPNFIQNQMEHGNFESPASIRSDVKLQSDELSFRGFSFQNRPKHFESNQNSPNSRCASRKYQNSPNTDVIRVQHNTNQNTNKNKEYLQESAQSSPNRGRYATNDDTIIEPILDIPDPSVSTPIRKKRAETAPPMMPLQISIKSDRRISTSSLCGSWEPASPLSPVLKAVNIFSHRKQTESRRVPLPQSILDEIGETIQPEILNAFDVMKGGETLLMVEYTRWVKRTVNTHCYLTPDMMHVTFIRRRCWAPKAKYFNMKDTIDIREILMARSGKEGILRDYYKDLLETRCFSIVFDDSSKKAINFVAESAESAKYWVKGINYIKKKLEELTPRLKQELFIWEIFKETDKDQDGVISYREFTEMMERTGIPTLGQNIMETYRKYVFNPKIDQIMFYGFVKTYQEVTLRPEIVELFHEYSADGTVLTARELYKFLQDQREIPEKSQGEDDIKESDCHEIIDDYEMDEDNRLNKKMTVHCFEIFLNSSYCDVFNRRHDEVYQDMKHPLSHYFIASSHNTYLTGDQLKDPSNTDAYMKALLQGCRCVELDCWDGSDDEPVIYHGYTLTSKIKFKDAIEVIGKHAFEVSRYPLILSIENHCSVPQQEKMADYMKKILGTELLTDYVIPEHEEFHLPSPDALIGKILIKGKKLPPPSYHDNDRLSSDDVSDEDEAAEMDLVLERMNLRRRPRNRVDRFFRRRPATPSDDVMGKLDGSVEHLLNNRGVDSNLTTSLATPSVSNQSSTRTRVQEKKLKLSKNLSDQVIYCKSCKFKGTEQGQQESRFREISSFSENKAAKFAKQTREAINYHVEHLDRTYPGAARQDSSNYDPQPLWNAGFQVVALNYQTKCDKMILYHGKFRQNGKCGYILKPEYMRSVTDDVIRDSHGETTKQLKIKVLSGYRIPVNQLEGDVSLKVEVSITGDPGDGAEQSTKIVKTNGYNPVWNQEVQFLIRIPSLAMVWFIIRDEDSNNRVALFVLPFSSVAKGYRTVHLLDEDGTPIRTASLLLYVSVNDVT